MAAGDSGGDEQSDRELCGRARVEMLTSVEWVVIHERARLHVLADGVRLRERLVAVFTVARQRPRRRLQVW